MFLVGSLAVWSYVCPRGIHATPDFVKPTTKIFAKYSRWTPNDKTLINLQLFISIIKCFNSGLYKVYYKRWIPSFYLTSHLVLVLIQLSTTSKILSKMSNEILINLSNLSLLSYISWQFHRNRKKAGNFCNLIPKFIVISFNKFCSTVHSFICKRKWNDIFIF